MMNEHKYFISFKEFYWGQKYHIYAKKNIEYLQCTVLPKNCDHLQALIRQKSVIWSKDCIQHVTENREVRETLLKNYFFTMSY